MKKIVYLALALLVPVLVFVFLKYAGSNRFDIPVYYREGIPEGNLCLPATDGPYTLPDTVVRFLPAPPRSSVVIFPEPGVAPRVIESLLVNEIGPGVAVADASQFSSDPVGVARWRDCVFLFSSPFQTVLVDNQRRIRGYYDLRKRSEMDRLRVELKILLEQY